MKMGSTTHQYDLVWFGGPELKNKFQKYQTTTKTVTTPNTYGF